MAYWDSNGHVTGDVMWPWKVKVVTPIYLGPLSRQRLEIRTWCERHTYRKWLPGNQNRMVTWLMTSHDSERSRSWLQYAYGPVSRKRLEIQAISDNINILAIKKLVCLIFYIFLKEKVDYTFNLTVFIVVLFWAVLLLHLKFVRSAIHVFSDRGMQVAYAIVCSANLA